MHRARTVMSMNNVINASEWGERHHRFGGGRPFLGLLIVVVVGIAVAALVMWLLGRRRQTATPASVQPSPTASAETILAERLARSEIAPDEYRSLLGALRGETPPAEPVSVAAAAPADDSATTPSES